MLAPTQNDRKNDAWVQAPTLRFIGNGPLVCILPTSTGNRSLQRNRSVTSNVRGLTAYLPIGKMGGVSFLPIAGTSVGTFRSAGAS